MTPGSALDPSADAPRWRLWMKRYRVGRRLAALRRLRRAPAQLLRVELARRQDRRGPVTVPGPRRQKVRSVIWIPVGPGSAEALWDTIDAIQASDGEDSQIVVVDDCTLETRAAVVRERYPEVDVVRNRIPTGGPPNLWVLCQIAMRYALERYDFEQLVKLDADAIVLAPEFSARSIERIAQTPHAGLAGAFRERPDGSEESDREYHARVLAHELPFDPLLRQATERAEAAGWRRGEIVQGGIMFLTREACEAIYREGYVDWRRDWSSTVSEDLALSLFVRAAGFELVSIGGRDGLVAVANKYLPVSKERLADGSFAAAHSIRVGYDGESEQQLRAFFAAHRVGWPDTRHGDSVASNGAVRYDPRRHGIA
jgi:hypothetical protein